MLSFELQSRSRPSHRLTQISADMRKGSVSHLRSCAAKFCYLLSCEGPAGAFFLLSAFTPIFFRNGSIDCLRPRNFSIERLTSRESPGSQILRRTFKTGLLL